jgi:DNA-binding MarR family transcriptional regulator
MKIKLDINSTNDIPAKRQDRSNPGYYLNNIYPEIAINKTGTEVIRRSTGRTIKILNRRSYKEVQVKNVSNRVKDLLSGKDNADKPSTVSTQNIRVEDIMMATFGGLSIEKFILSRPVFVNGIQDYYDNNNMEISMIPSDSEDYYKSIMSFVYSGDTLYVSIHVDKSSFFISREYVAKILKVSVRNITKHIKNLEKSGDIKEKHITKSKYIIGAAGSTYAVSITPKSFLTFEAFFQIAMKVQSKEAVAFRELSARKMNDLLTDGYVVDDKLILDKGKFVKLQDKSRKMLRNMTSQDGEVFATVFRWGSVKEIEENISDVAYTLTAYAYYKATGKGPRTIIRDRLNKRQYNCGVLGIDIGPLTDAMSITIPRVFLTAEELHSLAIWEADIIETIVKNDPDDLEGLFKLFNITTGILTDPADDYMFLTEVKKVVQKYFVRMKIPIPFDSGINTNAWDQARRVKATKKMKELILSKTIDGKPGYENLYQM